MRVSVTLVVGDHAHPDTISGYFGSVDKLLKVCREHCQTRTRLFVSNEAVVRAFQRLHRLGEIELVIHLHTEDRGLLEFIHDVKGYTVLPWPDQFFEMSYHMIFDTEEELKP